MINEITCDVCRDLIPLVKDGVASADSEASVTAHTKNCSECAKLFDGKITPAPAPSGSPKALLKAKRWLIWIYAALMVLGLYFGFTLTAGSGEFYNCLIMPVAGALGYMTFRWKSFYIMPLVLIVVGFLGNVMGFITVDGARHIDVLELIQWIIIYILFAFAGIIIAMLLRFAFGKSNSERGV